MAVNVSPGVYWREIDLSFYIPQLSSTQVGMVGTATKGPVNDRTLLTSVEQFVKTFGYPSGNNYACYAALQYLKVGSQLWFVRAESESAPTDLATATIPDIDAASITFSSKDGGTYYNNLDIEVSHGSARRSIQNFVSTDFTDVGGPGPYTLDLTLDRLLVKNSVQVILGSVLLLKDDGEGVLVDQVAGTSVGTVDYSTGDVSLSLENDPAAETVQVKGQYYSTFSISVVKTIESKPYVLETFKNLVLDSLAENFYEKRLKSSFLVSVADGALSVFLQVGSYSMSGGTDGLTGIDASDYIGTDLGTVKTGLKLLQVPEEVDLNAIAVPGISLDSVNQELISIAETRADCVALIDCPSGITPEVVVDWADGKNEYDSSNSLNSSYAATYYPWVKVYDEYNDENRLMPPSGFAAAAFAATDEKFDVWWAPAGPNVGKLKGVIGSERSLTKGERDFLYENRINPINDFPATGVMIWGQKTTQIYPTALDRINVRRLMIYIEKIIVTAVQPFVFRPNTQSTWFLLTSLVQPYLDSLVSKGALYDGKIVCDETTNTPEIIDQNQLVCNIFVKPVKTAEIITLNFVILSTGADIEEYVGQQF